ncbi:hypothetical protein LTR78_001363 [Recurvomyces mirabilis]|uniref:Mediator of RNA polymerase II transcription subunit 1 n=1 Tax=Recurvomyces mirabilis TaxID=574656 RepID=A0AAE0WW06_9PEZI|nr:hypothetical protein LTR78_001363 [Recurvomyces mirabilis]KAK5161340.1 hypothetical protein LTS14_001136 [Recurvomyces mirabilis]
MATPTPSHPLQPSSATKKTAGHVSTPAHLGQPSPAPRSVPSPAALRKDQAGRTPLNHPTTGSTSSKTIGSTPMLHSLSQQGNTVGSSPGANMLSFGTPIGLGVEGITPSQLNMHTPALNSIPMSLTMSDLGVPAGGAIQKRDEDNERKRKMRKVLKGIGQRSGSVSEEGILRVSRRVGFDNTAEDNKPVGSRSLTMAGKKMLVDVKLNNHEVENVGVIFDTAEGTPLSDQAPGLAKVLSQSLQSAGNARADAELDLFAANLGRLAKIDKLSSQHLNCFEALSGIYTSLDRLHEHEVAMSSDVDVLRKKSGRPTLHASNRVGVSIAYWQLPRPSLSRGDQYSVSNEVHNLDLGVERSSGGMYPPLRVSENWLPDSIELPADTSDHTIPWQDPPPNLVPAIAGGDAMAVDGQESLPELRFIAKLRSPVLLPWQGAVNVLQAVGMQPPQLFVYPPAWHTLLLDPSSTTPFNAGGGSYIVSEQTVLSMHGDLDGESTHIYTLDVAKPDGGYMLEELPFSHPRQLVELLPTLRQWVYFGSLIKDLFDTSAAVPANGQPVQTEIRKLTPGPLPALTLAELLTPPTTPGTDDPLRVSVSLATTPMPTLSLTFPSRKPGATCNVTLQIHVNGNVVVTHHSRMTSDAHTASVSDDAAREKLAAALEQCGDLGVWIEWLSSM